MGDERARSSAPLDPTRRLGPLSLLDAAVYLARRQPLAELARAWSPAATLLWLCLATLYLEEVEGVRDLRGPVAAALVAGWCVRAWALSRWAGRRARELLAELDPEGTRDEDQPGRAVECVRTGLWVGAGLWLWLWLLVGGLRGLSLAGLALVAPLLSVRGGVAPAWLARADRRAGGSGWARLRRAIRDSRGLRGVGIVSEGLLLAGAAGLFVNLSLLAGAVVGLLQSMLGLDLALVDAFLSTRNHFAILLLAGAALTLLEPLRASLAALIYARAQADGLGLDVRGLVDRCTAARPARRGAHAAALLLALALPSPLLAQAAPPCQTAACEQARARDAEVDETAARILRAPAYREFTQARGEQDATGPDGQRAPGGFARWLERLFKWLAELFEREDETPAERPTGTPWASVRLPGRTFFLALAAVAAGLALAYFLSRRDGPREDEQDKDDDDGGDDPLQRAPEEHLRAANDLATQRDLRGALRALYLATLVALDRRDRIRFSPERTNGQYLRQMPRGPERDAFAQFTRIFDYSWYGEAPPTEDHYETCRRLAERLCAEGP